MHFALNYGLVLHQPSFFLLNNAETKIHKLRKTIKTTFLLRRTLAIIKHTYLSRANSYL